MFHVICIDCREVQAELKRQRIERCSAEITEAILNSSVLDMTLSLSEEFYQKDVVERLEKLEDYEQCVNVYVNQTTKLSVESPIKFLKRLEAEEKALTAHEIYRNLCQQKAWRPLDLNWFTGWWPTYEAKQGYQQK